MVFSDYKIYFIFFIFFIISIGIYFIIIKKKPLKLQDGIPITPIPIITEEQKTIAVPVIIAERGSQ